ncbi:MAG: c-type cytochrome, partial [Gemmataceae bacterium]
DLEGRPDSDTQALELAARLGSRKARAKAQGTCLDQQVPTSRRVHLLGLLCHTSPTWARKTLLDLVVEGTQPVALRRAAVENLATQPEVLWAGRLQATVPALPPEVAGPARRLLLSRANTARVYLDSLDRNPKLGPVPTREEAQALVELKDPSITAWVEKKYGKIGTVSGEKQARISYIDLVVGRLPPGNPKRGKDLFVKQQCANCHTLFGEGTKLGPDLTTADRGSRRALITHIVEPSGAIRPEFQSHVVETTDGKFITGLMVESPPDTITLADVKNFRTTLKRSDVENIQPANISLMPEKLLDGLTDEQLADFFAYLMAPRKPD